MSFAPVFVTDVETAARLPSLRAPSPAYHLARVLVRVHGEPVGEVEVPLTDGVAEPQVLAAAIWSGLASDIRGHYRGDGLPPPEALPPDGFADVGMPRCRRLRSAFLEQARPATVVICSHDGADELARVLPAVVRQDHPSFEVVVVDNAPSTPAVAAVVRQVAAGDPRVRYVVEPRKGVSVARNRGLGEARSDRVAFLDDDEMPDACWLANLMRGFDAAPNVAAVSGPILPVALDTEPQAWFESFGGHSKGRGFQRAVFDRASHRQQSPLFPTPPFGAGGNMAFDRAVLLDLGGFDEALGAGTPARAGEDTAAFYDVMRAGGTVVYEPTAIVRHDHYRSVDGLVRQVHGYGVGLAAFYTRAILRDPRTLTELIRLAPRAVRTVFGAPAPDARDDTNPMLADLRRSQRRGLAVGAFAYLRARAARRVR